MKAAFLIGGKCMYVPNLSFIRHSLILILVSSLNIDVEPQAKGCYDIEDLDLPQTRIRSIMGLVSTYLERIYFCYVRDTEEILLLF